jgi:predicted RNase H-like nuclease
VPCGAGWLVAPGRLQGITLSCADPQLFPTFLEVLDYKPSYEIMALGCRVGLLDTPTPGGRTCDREARRLLGHPRGAAIFSAPIRPALVATTYEKAAELNGGMSPAAYSILARVAEVDAVIAPYWQRSIYEVHPELSFYQLNDDAPVRYSKHGYIGYMERRALLERKVQGVAQILDAPVRGARRHHLMDAAACLWTARRIAGRAVNRLPEDPEWDAQGLRMEIVR